MVRESKNTKFALAFAALLLPVLSGTVSAQQDPPSRVARLSYFSGNVSMQPAGVDEWAPAELNRPFTIGDYLYADQTAQAELHLDEAVIRMGSTTSFGFLNLDDRTVQLKLTEGDLYVRLHNFGSDQVFEVDTPNAAVTLLRDGMYRFRVDPNGSMSFVVVRQGQAEITGGGQAFTLNADNSATLTGTDQLSFDVELAPQPDAFDQWCEGRDAHEAQLASARYLPPTVIGSEDLDDYGSWQNNPDYGSVWYPTSVTPGWAPYQSGHWAWIDPWGWTWIDGMPWGFAPFHYGRWVYFGSRWGWCPGPIAIGYRGPAIRPYYAPAMVAWFGGAHWGVGISIGGGPSLGWVPLGWGEVYTPAYHCSPRYFNNVNVYNTRIVNNVNITNVYNTVYVNKQVYNQQFVNVRAPNAVMAMPQTAFASGRPVQQAAAPVRPAEFARMQSAAVVAPPVAPTRQSFLASSSNRPVVRPAAQVVQRPVVARNTPPPTPASFAARQPYLDRQAGQPFNAEAVRSSLPAAATVRPAVASVRPAPAATPVTVRPGERGGNTAELNRVQSKPAEARPVQSAPQPAASRTTTGAPPAPASSRVGVSGPAEQPAPATHGVPPNLRQQQQPNSQPAANERYNGTTPNDRYNQPPANTNNRNNEAAPASRPNQPAANERYNGTTPNDRYNQPPANTNNRNNEAAPAARPNQPAANERYESQPPARQTETRPQTPEPQNRTQPEYRAPAAPDRTVSRPEPQAQQQRSAPAPERRTYPERTPEPRDEHSQPPQQHESKPSTSSHEDRSKPDHKSK